MPTRAPVLGLEPRYLEVWLHDMHVGWLCEAGRATRFGGMAGFIPVEANHLPADGEPALVEWGAILIAEKPGREPIAAIVDMVRPEDGRIRVPRILGEEA